MRSIGLAVLGAPLTAATLGAVGGHDQGVASGVHNTVGQLAGLLMIAVLPAVAGLSDLGFDDPEFAGGYRLATRACAGLCIAAAAVAALTIPPRTRRADREVDAAETIIS
ncbi:MAG: hypothetical protein AAFP84_16660 [Actinomycetota bacterium]